VPIKTYSAEEFIKNELEFSCYFTTDLQRAKQTITAIINSNPYVVFKENTTVSTTEFYHSGIILKAYFYTSPKIKSAFFVKNQIKMMVNDVYKSGQAGLDRAYPHIAYTVDANDTNLL
jgi:small-conductance mechanosensitive channel